MMNSLATMRSYVSGLIKTLSPLLLIFLLDYYQVLSLPFLRILTSSQYLTIYPDNPTLLGDVNGGFSTSSNVFTTTTNGNSVSLYVSTRTLDAPGSACNITNVFSIPFCEDEAYTELGIHEICFGLRNEQGGRSEKDK